MQKGKNMKRGKVEELQWQDVRDDFRKANLPLANIIDELNLTKKHTFIKAKYPFGSKIVYRGLLHIANPQGDVVPLIDSSIPESLREKLSYRSVPTGLVIKNEAEVFFHMEQRIISLNLFAPGYILGLWEALDPPTSYLAKRIWSVSAGARNILMMPKIADSESHAVLQKEFGVPRRLSKDMQDQWRIFSAIANSNNFKEEWNFEILYLSKGWLESIKNKDKGWEKLEQYFLQSGWAQSSYWRNKVTYDLIWEIFISSLTNDLIKPNPYDFYTAKHLILVGTGVLPAFKPATNNLTAPINFLQEVFANRYGLKIYVPTIMVPQHLDIHKPNEHVYYSLQFPTLLESSPKTKNYPSLIANLREVKSILEKFREEALSGTLGIEDTPLYDFVKKVRFDYFHSEADGHDGIRNSCEMPIEDTCLIHYPNKTETMRFSDKSRFVKGCIRISTVR